jgi:periplasmic protein TonB
MFEDSLVESQGRIRTKSRWFAIGSFFAQAALLVLLVLYPLLHPQALPKQSIARLLIAPPPPHAPAPMRVEHASAPSPSHTMPSLQDQLRTPRTIPENITAIQDAVPGPPQNLTPGIGEGAGIPDGLALGSPSPTVAVKPPAPKGPMRISSGVATGQLLNPIRPIYPAIAKQARIQGIVVIEATISRDGSIDNLQVTDGPPMLRQSALDAVAAARYRPLFFR